MNCVVNKKVAVVPVWNEYIKKYYDIGVLNGYKSGEDQEYSKICS